MRVVALDYGSARCGVAVSDPSGTLATPREPILKPGTKRAFAAKLAAAVDVPVELYDERFTTKLAAQAGGSASLDSRAAATLLDEWLALPIREENPPQP